MAQQADTTAQEEASKTASGKAARKVAVVLHYDVWDEDGNRLPAAPVVGVNDVGSPVREKVTHVSAALARALVNAGKATVPLDG